MKKGNVFVNIFVWMIFAFVISLISVIMLFIANTTEAELLEKSAIFEKTMGDNATAIIQGTMGVVANSFESFKWITVMLIVGMALSIMISAYFTIVKHPIFFIPYVLIMIVAVIVAVPISNTYEILTQNEILAPSFVGFWGQQFIFLNLPTWVTVIGFMSGILMVIGMVKNRDLERFG